MFQQLAGRNRIEPEIMLFRAVLDYALFDMTSKSLVGRRDGYLWMSSKDFVSTCNLAELDHTDVFSMITTCLSKYFPDYYDEFTCTKV